MPCSSVSQLLHDSTSFDVVEVSFGALAGIARISEDVQVENQLSKVDLG